MEHSIPFIKSSPRAARIAKLRKTWYMEGPPPQPALDAAPQKPNCGMRAWPVTGRSGCDAVPLPVPLPPIHGAWAGGLADVGMQP